MRIMSCLVTTSTAALQWFVHFNIYYLLPILSITMHSKLLQGCQSNTVLYHKGPFILYLLFLCNYCVAALLAS
jgi:hypothetical protein